MTSNIAYINALRNAMTDAQEDLTLQVERRIKHHNLKNATTSPKASSKSAPKALPKPAKAKTHLPTIRNTPTTLVTVDVLNAEGVKKSYGVHLAFITFHSAYFKAAFCGDFSESLSLSTSLNCEWETFDVFADWIYTDEITDANGEVPALKELVKVWLLAGYIQVPELQKQTLDLITKKLYGMRAVPTDVLADVYSPATEGSPLRQIFVYHAVSIHESQSSLFDKDEPSPVITFPHQMVIDMYSVAIKKYKPDEYFDFVFECY